MQTIMCYCAILALFYFELEGNFQVQVPGGLYLEGRFNEGFFALRVIGLEGGGGEIWRGLYMGGGGVYGTL